MTNPIPHPPMLAFPLLDAIYEQNTALLAGQRETIGLLTSFGETLMATKEEVLAQLEAVRTEAKAAEDRAQAQISALLDAATAANAALQALVAELQARPDVPDDVAARAEEIRADLADDFAPTPEPPPAA